MDSLRRKCFDCKHYTDVAVADTLDDGVIESKFDFYRRFAAAAAVAVGCKLIAYHSTDLIDSIRDADKSVHCVIDRSRFAVAVVVAEAEVEAARAGSAFCWALCEL